MILNNTNDSGAEENLAYQLLQIKGLGAKSLIKLRQFAGNLQQAMEMSEDKVRSCIHAKAAQAFLEGRNLEGKFSLLQLKEEKKIDFIPYFSKHYPERLRNIHDFPFALYVKGKLPANDKPSVAIIGARACSEYGKAVAYEFGRVLGRAGVQIISGMAIGIDGIAQKAATEVGGFTYGVLGCGADICYPPEHKILYQQIQECGGIISEYMPGTLPQSALFPQRNRIISGLADVILVIEARKRSGTYITVTHALEQGKEVYAVPGRITDSLSEGCNFLLAQGAGLATNPKDIIETLRWSEGNINLNGNVNKNFAEASSEEERRNGMKNIKREYDEQQIWRDIILSKLVEMPMDIDTLFHTISSELKLSLEELMLELMKMQMDGMIKGEGGYYSRNITL